MQVLVCNVVSVCTYYPPHILTIAIAHKLTMSNYFPWWSHNTHLVLENSDNILRYMLSNKRQFVLLTCKAFTIVDWNSIHLKFSCCCLVQWFSCTILYILSNQQPDKKCHTHNKYMTTTIYTKRFCKIVQPWIFRKIVYCKMLWGSSFYFLAVSFKIWRRQLAIFLLM